MRVPIDELQPCIVDQPPSRHHHWNGSSVPSQLLLYRPIDAEIIDRHKHQSIDYLGRCIVFVLIGAIFLFAILLAFLFVHWSVAFNRTQQNQSLYETDDNVVVDMYPPSLFDNVVESVPSNATTRMLIALPTSIIPMHYDLHIDITSVFVVDTMSSPSINGNVSILLQIINSTNRITFHVGIDVTLMHIRLVNRQTIRLSIDIDRVERNTNDQTATVYIADNRQLPIGWYTLSISYRTRICRNERNEGVHCYRPRPSSISTIDTNQSTIVISTTSESIPIVVSPIVSFTTKFEPSLAKTFFPCWDEPIYKSTFNISIRHPKHITVLTNTAVYRRRPIRRYGHVISHYHETPPMSTYLLAFAVGPFVNLATSTDRGLPLSIWTMPDDYLNAQFAANFSTKMFDRQETEFDIAYPLSKIDFVASRSFPVGGMENWGVVIFHHNMLLLDRELQDSNLSVELIAEQYKIEKIITHEISHQWFGNLVTMESWSELWLNEGFATYYVYEFLHQLRPNLTEIEYYLRLSQLIAKQTTNEKYSLIRHFTREMDVYRAFDRLHLYTKGCTIVRMIRQLIGDFEFRYGIRRYLKTNAYGSVNRNHLWRSLTKHVVQFGVDDLLLGDVMESWLINAGLPEIYINRSATNMITIEQTDSDHNRHIVYLRDFPSLRSSSSNQTWSIPISYEFQLNTNRIVRQFWLHNRSITLSQTDLNDGQYLLANPNWTFPYRVNYDSNNWHLLIAQLHRPSSLFDIPTHSRLQLIIDAGTYLMQSTNVTLYLDLLSYLVFETELSPLLAGLDALFRLVETYQGTRLNTQLLVYAKPIIDQFDRIWMLSRSNAELGVVWSMESNRLSQLYLLRCVINHRACIDESMQVIDHWLTNNPLQREHDYNHQLTIICHHLFTVGNKREFDRIDELLRLNAGKWNTILHMASCVRDDRLLTIVARQIVATRSIAIIASLLHGAYSLHYNGPFRIKLWRELLRTDHRTHWFVAASQSSQFGRLLLHSVRTAAELEIAARAIVGHAHDKLYLRSKFVWQETVAVPTLQRHLMMIQS